MGSARLSAACVLTISALVSTMAVSAPAAAESPREAVVNAAVEGEWSPPEDAADGVPDPSATEPRMVEESADASPGENGSAGSSKGDAAKPPIDSQARSLDANRAPAGTTVGAPGLGEMPYFTFQDFQLTPDQTARVNLANGNLLLKAADIAIAGPGYALREDRYYNGLSDDDGRYGGGWHSSTNDTTVATEGLGGALVTAFNGAEIFFEGSGREPGSIGWGYPEYIAPPGSNMTFENYNHGFRITMNRTGETMTPQTNLGGVIIRWQDRNGVGVSRPFSTSGPETITHDSGRSITFNKTSDGSRYANITDSAGRKTSYSYEAVGSTSRLKSVTAVDGRVTTYSYDSTGRVSSIVLPSAVGTTTTVSFTYDALHRVKKVTQEPGIETLFSYTSGQTIVTDPNGNPATYTIDSDGLVTATKDALNRSRSQQWTANRDIQKTTDAIGTNDTTYTYDGSGNQLSAKLPTGAAAAAVYAVGAECNAPNTGTAYQAKCSTDDAGNRKQYEYDAAGNLTKIRDTTNSTAVTQVEYTYGNCGGFGGQVCTSKDGRGNLTTYAYDTKGNLTKVTPPSPMGATTYSYDSLGRVKTVTDGKGDVTSYSYDVKDRVLQTTFNNAQKVTSTFFPNGLEKTRADSAGGSIAFEYDRQGRMTKQTGPRAGIEQSFSYDEVGNMLSYTDSSGTVSYAYDAANQLVRLSEPGGTCATSGNPAANSGCIKFEYDQNAAEVKRILPAGAAVTTSRDGAGRPTRITAKDDTGSVAVDIGYSYAAAGGAGDRANIQTRTAFKEEGVTAGAVTSYAYDSRNRLISAAEKVGSSSSASWAYQYDADGNRTRQVRSGATGATAGTINYSYNAASQLTSSTGQATTWTYDAAGNQTRNGATGQVATYGDRGQVAQLGTVGNGYFATGNMDRLSAGSAAFNSSALGLANRTIGNATQTYTRTPVGQAVAFKATNRYYFAQDHLGSVVGIFSGTGKYSGGYSYSPYGEARGTGTSSPVVANPLRYIGGYHEGDGIYKLGARYYDTSLGRFTQMDPSGQESNPYAYAGCNPINSSDPSGLDASGCLIASLATLGASLALAAEIVGALALGLAPEPVVSKLAAWGIVAAIGGTYFGAVAALLTAIEECSA